MFRRIIVYVIFITGMLIFFYPIVSNWLSSKVHYTVISEHNEVIANMSDEQKKKELEKAKEYNESVQESSIPIEDPFAENIEEEVATGYFDVLDIGEALGYLEIPAIDVELPIYHGVSEKVLQKGIGHMSNSSFPIGGHGTHSALTGHRGLPSSKLFRHLDKVQIGDVFYINTLGETLAYEVDDIKIVLPNETQWLDIDPEKDYVTLITCEPYMINTHRLLVRGERIPYEEAIEVSANDISQNGQKINKWILVISLVGITGLVAYLMRKKWLRKSEHDV